MRFKVITTVGCSEVDGVNEVVELNCTADIDVIAKTGKLLLPEHWFRDDWPLDKLKTEFHRTRVSAVDRPIPVMLTI